MCAESVRGCQSSARMLVASLCDQSLYKLSAGSYVVSSPKYCIVLVMVCKRTCLRICSTPPLMFDSAAQRRVLRALRGLRPWEAWGLKRSTRVDTKLRA